jgi:hypothetical protein
VRGNGTTVEAGRESTGVVRGNGTTVESAQPPGATEQNSAVLDTCPEAVSAAIAEHTGAIVDQPYLDAIWRDCRAAAPSMTPEECADLVREIAPVVRAKKNQPGNGYLRSVLVAAAGTPAVLGRIRRAADPPRSPWACPSCGIAAGSFDGVCFGCGYNCRTGKTEGVTDAS